ncbi:PST family polysaccharide transporter [Lapidilactobacillus concavus DSM 17758]|uniref:PST family polysaccharide transporter n=1 Tax=Lapidilactobacillus concavus DSM 17758 TaxID=1423735 RepID=A0A0R1VXJ5_9LACO|nr:oligosaccharide flippase family protein [Lapidilactobacillus concavus]KRM07769.1 PST family polysaccharide transporter [Lapidilactobacillus concavus DSM 17758]GEL13710.1 flippase [Lapidilactobacillus concavus]
MKVLKNFLYTSGYQIFSIIVPIITTPYISRRLGPSGVGVNAFSLSMVQVFVLFAYLGTQKYGNNIISKNRDSPSRLLVCFKSIYLNQILTTTVTLFLYFFYVINFVDKYQQLYLIQGLYLVSVYFDVSWFFQGKEDFRTTVVRGMGSKLLGMTLIFVMIHGPEDTLLYGLILAASSVMANVVMWLYVWREIDLKQFLLKKIHLKPFIDQLKAIITYFIPVAFLQLTTLMYQLILGWNTNNIQVAYYANATKIVSIPLYIITSFITVMFPRMSYELSMKENDNKSNSLLKSSIEITMLLSVPLTFGLIAISPNFVSWFFGNGFSQVSPVMIVLSLRIVPATLNEAFGYLYLMASGRALSYSRALSVGGVVSLVLNYCVTLSGGAIATAWVAVVSETLILLVILSFSASKIKALRNSLITRSILYSIVMFIPIYLIGRSAKGIQTTIIQIVLAILIYGTLILVFERHNLLNSLRSLKR